MIARIQFNAESYFDKDAVLKRLGKHKADMLGKLGAYTRRRARSRIRKPKQQPLSAMTSEERKNFRTATRIAKQEGRPAPKRKLLASKPGEAPRDVTGTLKRGIEFAAELERDNVVVGPASAATVGPEAPNILEYGGTTRLTGGPDEGESVRVAPRPFMHPAFQSSLDDLPELLQFVK